VNTMRPAGLSNRNGRSALCWCARRAARSCGDWRFAFSLRKPVAA
jgi:hypothetical protein